MEIKKTTEFVQLFQEFALSYPYTTAGLHRTSAYDKQRQQGQRNFQAICSALYSGEDVTETILFQLLPHKTNPNKIQTDIWIHHASTIIKRDIKQWFESSKRTKPQDWPKVAMAILNFVRRCNNNPSDLLDACQEFSFLSYAKGFQTSILTPILNALRPDDFLLITPTSRRVINYFANTSYSPKLTDYPSLNITGRNLINKLAPEMHKSGVPALRDDDLFDMFCYWLIFIKRHHSAKIIIPTKIKNNLNPKYCLSQCAADTGLEEKTLEFWLQALERKNQAIFYGPPGTGKTFIAKKIAQHLIAGGDGFSELIQFHPAYTYEDFIQGIRPQQIDGKLSYSLVDGRFLEFCNKIRKSQDISVLIIDEINRANIARVFGELMYLLEYRDETITLAGGQIFSIPANLRIIGTMNTADRSIALVDHALRRRFAFIPLYPNYDFLRRYHTTNTFSVEGLIKVLTKINQEIGNFHYEIGCSFFLQPNLNQQIESIWKWEIEPYLEEYFFEQTTKINQFRWEQIKPQILP